MVVQALVEHFSQKGQPDAVEKAVLHMDIASLDLNQVSQPHTAPPVTSPHPDTVWSECPASRCYGNFPNSVVAVAATWFWVESSPFIPLM